MLLLVLVIASVVVPVFPQVFGGVPIIDEKVWGNGEVPSNGDAAPNIDDYNSYDDYSDIYDTNSTDTENFSTATTLPPDEIGLLKFIKALGNITKEAGESVKLKCEATGEIPPVKIRWFKNEAPVLHEKGRVVERRYTPQGPQGQNVLGSRLRIAQLDTHDTGYYRCEASNGQHKIESTGILMVKMNRWGRINAPADIPNFSPVFPNFPGLLEGRESNAHYILEVPYSSTASPRGLGKDSSICENQVPSYFQKRS